MIYCNSCNLYSYNSCPRRYALAGKIKFIGIIIFIIIIKKLSRDSELKLRGATFFNTLETADIISHGREGFK